MAAMCRRNSTYNTSIPIFDSHGTSDNLQNYQCSYDGPIKTIDRFGYHITGCKKDGNAICLHDNVVHIVVTLFRSIGLSVALEPMHLFSDFEPDDNRRPDILIRNPYGGGRQIIIDVAVTGIDGTARTNNNKPNQPIIARRKQKTRKYEPTAEANHLYLSQLFFLIPAKWK